MKILTARQRPYPRTGVYDTGKVLIGLEYRPIQRMDTSVDMEAIQAALLRKPKPFNWSFVVYVACLIAVAALIVTKP